MKFLTLFRWNCRLRSELTGVLQVKPRIVCNQTYLTYFTPLKVLVSFSRGDGRALRFSLVGDEKKQSFSSGWMFFARRKGEYSISPQGRGSFSSDHPGLDASFCTLPTVPPSLLCCLRGVSCTASCARPKSAGVQPLSGAAPHL